jgi:hypothetical protein
MKKIFTLAILSLLLISCSNDECSNRCGRVVDTLVYLNAPRMGDEIYEITYISECGEERKIRIPIDMTYGSPGNPYQTVPKAYIDEQICEE